VDLEIVEYSVNVTHSGNCCSFPKRKREWSLLLLPRAPCSGASLWGVHSARHLANRRAPGEPEVIILTK
jgi:hypothetical protein